MIFALASSGVGFGSTDVNHIKIFDFIFKLFNKIVNMVESLWNILTYEFNIDIFDFHACFQTIDLIFGAGVAIVLAVGIVKYFLP